MEIQGICTWYILYVHMYIGKIPGGRGGGILMLYCNGCIFPPTITYKTMHKYIRQLVHFVWEKLYHVTKNCRSFMYV